jgi:hypothetical protein
MLLTREEKTEVESAQKDWWEQQLQRFVGRGKLSRITAKLLLTLLLLGRVTERGKHEDLMANDNFY